MTNHDMDAATDFRQRCRRHYRSRNMDEEGRSEAPCSPNGFGFCSTHPTCEYVACTLREYQTQAERVKKLDAELETTADKLSDCWLLLDEIARNAPKMPSVRAACENMLRKQQAPGWMPITFKVSTDA